MAMPLCGGCVERVIEITSDPAGALVWINDREVGRTPLEVEFLHYGTFDVRLELDGYEPLDTSGEAMPPWWDQVPFDLFAEAVPGQPESRVEWHYELAPRNDDRSALMERALELRGQVSESEE